MVVMLVVCKLVLLILPVISALNRPTDGSNSPSDRDGSRIVFRDADGNVEEPGYSSSDGALNETIQVPPVDLLKDLSNYEVNDLLLNFVEYDDVHQKNLGDSFFLEDRFGGTERNSALMAKAAACIPELRTIQLASSDDPTVMYIPQCTRVEKCGGCCSHRLLSCQATQTELVNFQVTKTKYTGGKKLRFVGKEVITVERHTKCKCDCRIKGDQCNRFQEYRSNECRCVCTNRDEQKKCEKEYEKKTWNPSTCACECISEELCSTGQFFDRSECRCRPLQIRRRYAFYDIDRFTDA